MSELSFLLQIFIGVILLSFCAILIALTILAISVIMSVTIDKFKKLKGLRMQELNDLYFRKLIQDTVNMTVLKLKMSGLMKDDRKSSYQKTEELLKSYDDFLLSDQPYTIKLIDKINVALYEIKDDIYYDIIPLFYFKNETREFVAEHFNTTVTTISRNKTRLVNRLKTVIFSDDVIYELFL